jgi:hypothetical protein
MAFSGNAMSTSFKQQLLIGAHNFTAASNVFRLALYTNSAVPSDMGGSGSTMDGSVANYASNNEVSGTNYVAKGNPITTVTPTTAGTTAYVDCNDVVFSNVTISAVRGALFYNDAMTSPADAAVAVLDFGSDKAASTGDFTVVMPAAGASTAIIRIA